MTRILLALSLILGTASLWLWHPEDVPYIGNSHLLNKNIHYRSLDGGFICGRMPRLTEDQIQHLTPTNIAELVPDVNDNIWVSTDTSEGAWMKLKDTCRDFRI